MNASRLHDVLQLMVTTDRDLTIQRKLQNLADAFDGLVQTPGGVSQQGTLAKAIIEFETALQQADVALTPAQKKAIDELGGGEFFGPELAAKISQESAAKAMTPSVVSEFVKSLASRRQTYMSSVETTLRGLKEVNITGGQPDNPELAVMIPRSMFHSELGSFTKELKFLDRFVKDVSEAITGKPSEATIDELSTTDPLIVLATATTVVVAIGGIVKTFLSVWKDFEEVRLVQAKVKAMNLSETANKEMEHSITSRFDEVVEKQVQDLLVERKDDGRKKELAIALRADIKHLYMKIEEGMTVEVRVNEEAQAPNDAAETAATLELAKALSRELYFPKPEGTKILALAEPEEDEDDEPVKTVKPKRPKAPKKQTE